MKIKCGTAGWSYKDWEGIVYKKAASGLEVVSRYLDMVEVNSSFYHIPKTAVAEKWPKKTEHNPEFTFVLKLWQGFTHSGTWNPGDERGFLDVCDVLKDAGKLGGLLAQFPFYFEYSAKAMELVRTLSALFEEYRLFYEFRHKSWLDPARIGEVRKTGGLLCNIDLPGGEGNFNDSTESESSGGYLRLHGRNSEAWFSKDAGRDQKYDYLYKEEEIDNVVKRIRAISEKAGSVFVVANNHFKGKAVANSLQLKSILTGNNVQAPEDLVMEYPYLSGFTDTGGLFSP